jgi:hypothetical protein
MINVKVLDIKDNESVRLLKIENRRRISALFLGETKLSYKTASFFLFKGYMPFQYIWFESKSNSHLSFQKYHKWYLWPYLVLMLGFH